MTKPYPEPNPPVMLPYGDGSYKIFGMENFGNTCYCNSILQCLYYTENFRKNLVSHKFTKHEPKLKISGFKLHSFSNKYEQLLQKKLKEQGKVPTQTPISAGSVVSGSGGLEERPKSSRKGSLFGIKFNNSSSTTTAANVIDSKTASYIREAKDWDVLTLEQRLKIKKCAEFQKLPILMTRPTNHEVNPSGRVDYSQSSSMLLNGDQPQQTQSEGSISSTSSAIIVGIPHPETNLLVPINPFNVNPGADQRKRSALINGPIINLDASLQIGEQHEDSILMYALKDIFESMIENKSTIGVVSPNYFIQKLKDRNYLFRQNNMHHDAHEFFNYLINEIIETLNREVGPENNWCNNIFRGSITNETKCLSCETVSSRHEYFLDLSIDIPPGESAYSLSYSLNNFSKSETLTNQNKFYCNTCSSLQEAVKTIKLNNLPEVLVINFKRFKYDETVDKMVKLFDSISYPFKLKLFNTTDDDQEQHLYELYALVVHIGGGPMHGHYVSICKTKYGLWLLFDDETVELVDDSYVMRFFGNGPGLASAYILFYNKCHEASDDVVDFGFDISSIYKGGDFGLLQQVNNNSDLSLKKPTTTEEVEQEKSETSSVNSYNAPEAKKQGVFKPFKFDGTKEEKPLSRSSSNKEPKEKKSWGLKWKNSSDTTNSDKKASVSGASSSGGTIESPVPERKKSIFGFKRK